MTVVQAALLSSTDDNRGLIDEKDAYAVKNDDTVTVLYYNYIYIYAGKLEIRYFTPLAEPWLKRNKNTRSYLAS